MSNSENFYKSDIEKLKRRVSSLEARLITIEHKADLSSTVTPLIITGEQTCEQDKPVDENDRANEFILETRVGEYGLAWIGSIVLLFGIIFFTGYLRTKGLTGTSTLTGYACLATILFISGRIKDSFPHMGFVLNLNGHILLYYITLRLHFFSSDPFIQNATISLILLFLVVIVQGYIAVLNKSQALFGLVLTATLFTAIVSDATHVMLPIVTLTSVAALYFLFRFQWKASMNYSIILVYITFLIWFLNNPIMGHPYGAIVDHHNGVIYIFVVGAVYSLVALARLKDKISENYAVGVTVSNGLSFSLLLALLILQFYSNNYIGLFSAITLYCLGYSIVLKTFSKWKFTSASYALYGFVAMSIVLYGLFGLPDVFLVLALQSLVVVSFALWFRNKIIVIMNALLLISLLIIYLTISDPVNGVNIAFAIVTLLTARILNWKKERLVIMTDMLRNFFLVIGFFLVLYTFFHWPPKQYITLCWSAAALLYFVLSIILNNKKYRYMALCTVVAASFYLLFVDLAKIEILYRVFALMFLAFISIGISIYYSKNKKSSQEK